MRKAQECCACTMSVQCLADPFLVTVLLMSGLYRAIPSFVLWFTIFRPDDHMSDDAPRRIDGVGGGDITLDPSFIARTRRCAAHNIFPSFMPR